MNTVKQKKNFFVPGVYKKCLDHIWVNNRAIYVSSLRQIGLTEKSNYFQYELILLIFHNFVNTSIHQGICSFLYKLTLTEKSKFFMFYSIIIIKFACIIMKQFSYFFIFKPMSDKISHPTWGRRFLYFTNVLYLYCLPKYGQDIFYRHPVDQT